MRIRFDIELSWGKPILKNFAYSDQITCIFIRLWYLEILIRKK
jgi:hypothetical protein